MEGEFDRRTILVTKEFWSRSRIRASSGLVSLIVVCIVEREKDLKGIILNFSVSMLDLTKVMVATHEQIAWATMVNSCNKMSFSNRCGCQ